MLGVHIQHATLRAEFEAAPDAIADFAEHARVVGAESTRIERLCRVKYVLDVAGTFYDIGRSLRQKREKNQRPVKIEEGKR